MGLGRNGVVANKDSVTAVGWQRFRRVRRTDGGEGLGPSEEHQGNAKDLCIREVFLVLHDDYGVSGMQHACHRAYRWWIVGDDSSN